MADFDIRPLSERRIESIRTNTEYSDDSPVSLEQIVAVYFLHETFDIGTQKGQIHILDAVAENVLELFRKLYVIEFPIHSAIPVDEFQGDDVKSMEANNSSGFNPRKIMHTDRWSSHAYGCAIDINPRQNPYVLNPGTEKEEVYPDQSSPFLDRDQKLPGMVEPIVSIFSNIGYTDWGGAWREPLDYHHFQVPWDEIRSFFQE